MVRLMKVLKSPAAEVFVESRINGEVVEKRKDHFWRGRTCWRM